MLPQQDGAGAQLANRVGIGAGAHKHQRQVETSDASEQEPSEVIGIRGGERELRSSRVIWANYRYARVQWNVQKPVRRGGTGSIWTPPRRCDSRHKSSISRPIDTSAIAMKPPTKALMSARGHICKSGATGGCSTVNAKSASISASC